MYIISHTSRNSTLDYEQSIRKLNLGVNCLMYLPVHEQRRLAPIQAIHLAANDDLPSLRKKLPISNRLLRATRGSCSTANTGIG